MHLESNLLKSNWWLYLHLNSRCLSRAVLNCSRCWWSVRDLHPSQGAPAAQHIHKCTRTYANRTYAHTSGWLDHIISLKISYRLHQYWNATMNACDHFLMYFTKIQKYNKDNFFLCASWIILLEYFTFVQYDFKCVKVLIYAYYCFKCTIHFLIYAYLLIRDHCLLFWKKSGLIFTFCAIYFYLLLKFWFHAYFFYIHDHNTFDGKMIPYWESRWRFNKVKRSLS